MASDNDVGESAQSHQLIVLDHLRAEILKEEVALFFVAVYCRKYQAHAIEETLLRALSI